MPDDAAGRPSSVRYGYSRSFLEQEEADRYERDVYRPGSYDSWIWDMQRPYLLDVLERRLGGRDVRYLDFACGSGRVIAFLEQHVGRSTGVDTSASMLDYASRRVTRSDLRCADLLSDPKAVDGPFELVTAFRFFLNADDALRHEALGALRALLADDGVLVFNVHGNAVSMRFPVALFRRYVLRQSSSNQLTYWRVKRMLARHRLQVVEVRGFGLAIARVHKLFGPAATRRVERLVERFPALGLVCGDLVFVARPMPGA